MMPGRAKVCLVISVEGTVSVRGHGYGCTQGQGV